MGKGTLCHESGVGGCESKWKTGRSQGVYKSWHLKELSAAGMINNSSLARTTYSENKMERKADTDAEI